MMLQHNLLDTARSKLLPHGAADGTQPKGIELFFSGLLIRPLQGKQSSYVSGRRA